MNTPPRKPSDKIAVSETHGGACNMVSHTDIQTIASGFAKMSEVPDNLRRETALCLLNSLLPFELMLQVEANEHGSVDMQNLSRNFTAYVVALRDALLG